MSGIHRDKRATHNFSIIWKVEKALDQIGGETSSEAGWPPKGWGRVPHLVSQSEAISWILPPPPLRMNIIRDQGQFDPRDVVLHRGLYKQGP